MHLKKETGMNELKRILFDAYGGFADKRYKNLNKCNTFIIDDRVESDFGADGSLYSYFCSVFADVNSNQDVVVTLTGNIPTSKNVKSWLKKQEFEIKRLSTQSRLEIAVAQGEQSKLKELAAAFQAIVASGARYSVANYKYVCPRTADSLSRFAKLLDEAWVRQLPTGRKGFF